MQTPRRSWPRLGFGIVFALLAATRAEAHLVSSGAGSFYDGIGHFFLSPDDVLSVVAVALLAGLRGPKASGYAFWTLPVSWVAAGLIAIFSGLPELSEQISSGCSLLILGGLLAADLALPAPAILIIALLAGGTHGFFNGLAMRAAGTKTAIVQLAGVDLMVFVLVLHGTELAKKIQRPWIRVVVRVAGSWIGASGLLLLGWAIKSRSV